MNSGGRAVGGPPHARAHARAHARGGEATDRWFVRRGLPHAMPNYSAREDIWTRTWPFLLFVMFMELFTTFGDRYDGWKQLGVSSVGSA